MRALGRVADRWTALIRDELFLVSTELKNYHSDGEKANKSAEGSSNNGPIAAEGPLPDAMLNR